ncbi:MAG: putative lipid II flippase FtsW, partial [Acidobacteriota bacterium]
FATTVSLIALGLLMVYSASFPASQQHWGTDTHFLAHQLVSAVVGLLAMLMALRFDYRLWKQRPLVLLAVLSALVALAVVLFIDSGNGARRWIEVGSFTLQPSEPAKLALVLFLASYLARKEDQLNDWWNGLLPPLLVVGAFALLIAKEPDLGTAASIVAITAVLLCVAGLSWHYILGFSSLATGLATIQVLSTGYQMRRILAYLNPWADPTDVGFQTVQSLIAVGTGGVAGLGLAEGRQKLSFLPQPHTDFIFAVIGEELGLIGTAAVLIGFMLILWRGVRAALRAPDRFGFYLGIGLTTALVMQALLNMSVVVNLVPTTGIPLPLISYGGSSMVTSCVAIGVLLNLSQHS